jgi:glutamyl-tRNA(Gln) amidotransferase subunit E
MPLIETVTYPHMLTPDEAAEAAQYLRFLARSSGKVRTGIGAAREDVNVSIDGGTRVEIKGVQHISWIPELTHNEGFRQKALLEIRSTLTSTISDWSEWKVSHKDIAYNHLKGNFTPLRNAARERKRLTAVNLPGFRGILSFFTQPGQTFADEISGRLKVIACLETPNMLHSEEAQPPLSLEHVRPALNAGDNDAQIIVWGSTEDVETAVETIEERCRIAFEGVPNETRKSLPDGTTVFERVLPGPDRMYPDTDSAPLPIGAGDIDRVSGNLPVEIRQRFGQLKSWRIPEDTYKYLLKCNLVPTIEKIVSDCDVSPRFVGTLFGHLLKHLEGQQPWVIGFSHNKIYGMLRFIRDKNLTWEIARLVLPVVYEHPNMDFESVLFTVSYQPRDEEDILENLPVLREKFRQINSSKDPHASQRWIMGQLSKIAVGNMPLKDLSVRVTEELTHE